MFAGSYLPARFAASRGVRTLLTVTGGAAALWVLRRGAEVKQRVQLEGTTLELSYGARSRSVDLAEIKQVQFCSAFSRGRNWLAATILIDESGLEWRLSAFLERGDELLAAIADRGGRGELSSWIEARGVIAAMRASTRRLIVGYGVAIGAPAVTLLYGLWG